MLQRVVPTDVVTLRPTSRRDREVFKIGVANVVTLKSTSRRDRGLIFHDSLNVATLGHCDVTMSRRDREGQIENFLEMF